MGPDRSGSDRCIRCLHRRSAMDSRRCRARAPRKSVRRPHSARLSYSVTGRRDDHGARCDSAGRRNRTQLRLGQGALHCTGQGRSARAGARQAAQRRSARRFANADAVRLHARDRRGGETGFGRGAVVPVDWQMWLHRMRRVMAKNLADALEPDIREQAAAHTLAANPLVGVRAEDILASVRLLLGEIASNPTLAARQYMAWLTELGRLAFGGSKLAPDPKDRRFADPARKENAAYRALAQSYFAWVNALHHFVNEARIDTRNAERARFFVSLIVDALSPTNSLPGNPAALKKALETGGTSLLHGLENFIGDFIRNGGLPAQVDTRSFAVGRNIATTPGSVVLRTEVMELIQYRRV